MNQTGEQEEKVDYENLEQYTRKKLINICIDLNLTGSKSKNKDFIIQLIQARLENNCEFIDSEGEICSEKAIVSNSNGKRVCLEHQTGRGYCSQEGCEKQPKFGFERQKPLYCKPHKQAGMVDVLSKKCYQEDCQTRPSFGYEWQKPLYCEPHKQADMVNVVDKTCDQKGCQTKPSFGYEWQKPLYCEPHKQADVVHKKCSQEGCQTRPSFGYEWQKPLYCEHHKQADMVNVRNKTCSQEGCKTQNPKFGNHLIGRIHCVKHYDKKTEWKLSNCKSTKCRQIATHSQCGNYPYEFCDEHKPKNYSSNLTSTCKNCDLTELICDEEGWCLLTCTQIHRGRLKYSETEMLKFLSRNNIEFISNKVEDSSCSKKLPDFIFKTPYGVVLLENDEDQHKTYPCECEQTRMIQLHQSFGESVHFIRFNPDQYRSDIKNLTLEQRHRVLLKVLKPILNQPEDFFTQNQGLTIRYMYYDDCDGRFIVETINY